MSKTKKIAILAIIAMVLTLMPTALFAATADSTRLEGAGRVETALDIASAGWATAGTVVLAPADQANLVDALAAAPLAGQDNAPILLTFKGSLDPNVKAKIQQLGATKVYVVGAVSDAVAAEVDAITNVTVEKLAGADRWATADKVNAKLTSPNGTFVVGYDAIADALSASSFAAKNKYAIVLAKADGTVDSAKLVGATKYIVGGTSKVADIAGVTRLSGADRYATNADVATKLSFSYDRVYVANGVSLVDALAVAPLAAKYNAFVALASGSDVAAASVVNAKLSTASKVIAVGGANAVPAAVVGKVAYAAPATLAVESINVLNQKMLQVKFSKEVDKASAQTDTNYKIDGTALGLLGGGTNHAFLESDNKTVSIFLANSLTQDKKVTVEVSNVLDKVNFSKVPTFSQELYVKDITNPTVAKAEVRDGNKTLRITFNESVTTGATTIGNFKLNGNSMSVYGGTVAAYRLVTSSAGANQNHLAAVEIPLSTKLPAGEYTLTVKNNAVTDPAGLAVVDGSYTFTATDVTDALAVVETKATVGNPGTIEIKFNREVGTILATYAVNGTGGLTPVYKSSTEKDTLKITTQQVFEGANVVTIPKDQKDTYGNKIGTEDLRITVTGVKDTTAPTVSAVYAVNDKKVRVKFSEAVNVAPYITAKANYTIKDVDGVLYSSVKNTALYSITSNVNGDADLVDIDFTNALPGSDYTIEIKGVRDGSSNEVAAYTGTFTAPDKTAPTLATSGNQAYRDTANPTIEVFFSEPMNESTIEDITKFRYSLTATPTVFSTMPTGTKVEAASNLKSVVITFPGTVVMANISAIRVLDVKDTAGNVLKDGYQDTAAISTTGKGVAPKVVAKSAKVTGDTTKIELTFETDQQIVTIDKADFASFLSGPTVGATAPDSATVAAKKVTLTYLSTNANYAKIMADGKGISVANAFTANAGNDTENAYGDELTTTGLAAEDREVTDGIAPELVAYGSNPVKVATANTITVDFNENISGGNLDALKDDVLVTSDGAYVTITKVEQATTKLTFTTKETLTGVVTFEFVTDKLEIKDTAGNLYAPTNDDKKKWSVTVAKATSGTLKGALGASLVDATVQGLGDNTTIPAVAARLDGTNNVTPAALGTINAGTSVTFAVAGTNYVLSNATVASITAATPAADIATMVNNLALNGITPLSSVATATISGGKLVVTAKTAGAGNVVFTITDGSAGADKTAIEGVFGMTSTDSSATKGVAGAAATVRADVITFATTAPGVSHAITLDANYTAMTLANFVTALNAKLVTAGDKFEASTETISGNVQLVITVKAAGATTGLSMTDTTGTAGATLFGVPAVTNGTGAAVTGNFAR